MAKKTNRYLYQDKESCVWYFQKKVRALAKPYKISLETKSVVEARRKRDDYIKQIEANGNIPKFETIDVSTSKLFGEISQEWAEIARTRIEETTFLNYKKVMNAMILPKFDNRPIEEITSLDIEKFISKLTCGSKTKQNILTPFRNVMRFAKKHKYLKFNPFDDVDPIKKTASVKKRPLNIDEIRRFIDAVDDYWKPLFLLLFFSGIRIAEASGLKWKRVNLKKGIINISRNLVRGEGGKIIYKSPKTASSIRDVRIPKFVITALIEQRKRTWNENDDNFVFTNRDGDCIHRHTLNNAVIKPTLKKLEITTPISIKDTRVSFITNSLDKNERMGFIQKQVGHSSTRMIVDHYYRHIPATDDGKHLESAWNSTSILPVSEGSNLELTENIE
jgi:integrase